MFEAIEWWQILLRLIVSVILGACFGFEREIHKRPAGLRTNTLVALGSCILMIISYYGFEGVTADHARIAAAVVSGMGFIGAGAIMQQGANIRGLTTAATLWIVAAIGISVGAGYYLLAVASTFLGILTLLLFRRAERKVGKGTMLSFRFDNNEAMEKIIEISKTYNIIIDRLVCNYVAKLGLSGYEISLQVNGKESDINTFVEEIVKNLKPLEIIKN